MIHFVQNAIKDNHSISANEIKLCEKERLFESRQPQQHNEKAYKI